MHIGSRHLNDICDISASLQDEFISNVSKIKETVNRTSQRKKRGWFTGERMKTKLGWSGLLVLIHLFSLYRALLHKGSCTI